MEADYIVNTVYNENIFIELNKNGSMQLLVVEVTETFTNLSHEPNNQSKLYGYLDSGANVSIMTKVLFETLNFSNLVEMYDQPRRIYTAKEGQFMLSVGRVTVGGLIRTMELVPDASHNLLSTAVITRTTGVVISQYDNTCEIKFPDGTIKKYNRSEQNN